VDEEIHELQYFPVSLVATFLATPMDMATRSELLAIESMTLNG
jgi:hypothetical protein